MAVYRNHARGQSASDFATVFRRRSVPMVPIPALCQAAGWAAVQPRRLPCGERYGRAHLTAPSPKPARLNIRVSQHEKETLARAAELENTTISNFVLERAYVEAQALLADQNRFRLSNEAWRAFCAALDAPPKSVAQLRRLMHQRGVFDD